MKIHEYREMMRYLTRKPVPPMPADPAEIPETSDERFTKDVEFIDKIQTEADTQNKQLELATGGRVELAEGMNPTAITDVGENVIKDAKSWYEKFAPQVAKGASKTLRVIGTPAVSASLYLEDVYSDLKKAAAEGNVTASKTLDAIVGKGEKGLYFMLPELAKDVVTNPIASKILKLGTLGRLTTP